MLLFIMLLAFTDHVQLCAQCSFFLIFIPFTHVVHIFSVIVQVSAGAYFLLILWTGFPS